MVEHSRPPVFVKQFDYWKRGVLGSHNTETDSAGQRFLTPPRDSHLCPLGALCRQFMHTPEWSMSWADVCIHRERGSPGNTGGYLRLRGAKGSLGSLVETGSSKNNG